MYFNIYTECSIKISNQISLYKGLLLRKIGLNICRVHVNLTELAILKIKSLVR